MKKSEVTAIVLVIIFATSSLKPIVALADSEIDTAKEYVSGCFPGIWYTWINTLGTHVIFIALHQEQYNSPVFAFLGQHYTSSINSQVFVGNALTLMEVYNDTNGNGVLDANYTVGLTETELKYYLLVNSSITFEATPVQKTEINGVIHYIWGIRYGQIDGFLLYPHSDEQGYGWWDAAADVLIDYLGLSYDYSIEQNVTHLKTSYHIGNVTILRRKNSGVTLNGMSLSLLYTTQVISPKQYKIIVNNKTFNSTLNNSATSTSLAKIEVENIKVYEFRFKDNYTLHQNLITQHQAMYSACSTDSVQSQLFKSKLTSPLWQVEDYLKILLPEIGNFTIAPSLNYTASSFIYRISYPYWSGNRIEHDPTYVAFVNPKFPAPRFPVEVVSFAAITGVVILIASVYELRKIKRAPVYTHKTALHHHGY